MVRCALLQLVVLAGCARAVPEPTPDPVDPLDAVVGVVHPPRRADIIERSSYLVEESDKGRWVVAELIVRSPSMRAVSLDEVIARAPATRWRTVAVQRVSPGDSLFPVHLGTCEVSGRHDRLVIGVGNPSVTVPVRHAWRIDTVAKRFVGLDAATVHCVDLTGS